MPPHPLTNFEIQKFYQNEPKFNGVYSRNNLPKIKDGEFVINLDEYESVGTDWIALLVIAENVTYFDSFRVEHLPKEIRNIYRNQNIATNIYRTHAYDSVMWGHFSIGVLDFMLKDKIQIFIEYKHMIQYIGVIDFKLKGKGLLEYLFIYLFHFQFI